MLKIKINYWDGSKNTVYIKTEAAKQLLDRLCTEDEAWNSHEIIKLKITKITTDDEE